MGTPSDPREHIEQIRRETFYIGEERIPKAHLMLDQAVKFLSAELYTKDVHFLMELIQNAEDNDYLEGVDPSLEFVITSRDITATGALATLLLFNNEKGFSAKNIESICSLGHSTKKGNRKRGYIGEKGIGFKSVFLISAQPYIFSNGYQIRFNEKPCPHCKLGYIVPEWVEENPSFSDIKQIYGSSSAIPTTTIVLPLKLDKVKTVKQQLSSIHPEVLLFLSKIKRLSVREDNVDLKHNTVSAIAITKETDFMTRKNIDAESYTLHLSAEESSNCETEDNYHSYHVWKQKFPVKQENKIERRMEVEEWVITLAFPNGDRLRRGMKAPGVYAFLPTEMFTNFPFIIQADFILASSRETILLDNVWNQGILDCVPLAFVNALVSLVKTVEDAPVSSLPQMFEFLPVNCSPYPELNAVRSTIQMKLAEENIIPSESYMGQKFFHKPREVGRLMPAFWDILKRTRVQGVSLHNLSSHGWYILNSSFDKSEYDHILNFLGVGAVNDEWYAKCIRGSNLPMRLSEETYLELLLFLADNWRSKFCHINMSDIPLIKYVGTDGSVSLCSIKSAKSVLCISYLPDHVSWLIDWNKEFRCIAGHFFLPKTTQEAIMLCSRKDRLLEWLQNLVEVTSFSVYKYASLLKNHLSTDRKILIAYAHFLFHSFRYSYLSEREVKSLCCTMPLLDNYGYVTTTRSGVLVPAKGSKWTQLMTSNPWRSEGYIELGEDYTLPASFIGQRTTGDELINFLKTYLPAVDIPDVSPPKVEISAVYGPLTKQNALLLLDWIHNLKYRGIHIPEKFLNCIKKGSWLKTTINSSPGYRSPSQSFLLRPNRGNSNWGNVLQNGSVLIDIPLVDHSFYGDKINEYVEELKTFGVMFEYGEACEFIGNHLMSLAASSTLTRSNVISVLNFIKFLRQNFLSPQNFICSIKNGKWLRTTHGYKSPVESVLYDEEWTIATQVSDIPFIDQDYYGEEILYFKTELQLLGVIVGFENQVVADHLKSSSYLQCLSAEALLLILDCMQYSITVDKLVEGIKYAKCLKTNLGYKSPGECFLFDPEWGCLLKVFSCFPLVDCNFYENISFHKMNLKQLGVKVEFEEAVKAFVYAFRQQASLSSIRKENVLSFLSCYRQLKRTSYKFPSDLKDCIREVKWLRTRVGDYRSPEKCILFGPAWVSISPITILPFIDDSDNCYGKVIHEYKKELKSMGVVIEFKAGASFVASSLYFPNNSWDITPENVLSLLECMKILLEQKDYSFPESFLKMVSREWLKTSAGYRAPEKCCLFDPKWASSLKHTDGPFIDEKFYGSDIRSYTKELSTIGVSDGVEKSSSLLASHLDSHSDFATIVRIYNFLREQKWKPESKLFNKIWIPSGDKNGKWVKPEKCVLHDKDGLFGFTLNVLDKYYQQSLLDFFSTAFDVEFSPSLDDYCKLWKVWESSGHRMTHDECCAFWRCIMKNKVSMTERNLANDLVKLPVVSSSGEIFLFDKRDVFIGDDLQLKDLFEKFSPRPIFVWYPLQVSSSLRRNTLFEVFKKVGVRTISESVRKVELSLPDGMELNQLNSRGTLIGKVLVSLILGFLAVPSLNMEAKERHDTVECLLNLTVFETIEPINVSYTLSLSSGEIVNVKASRTIRWEKASSKIFAQKLDRSGGHKILIEYATEFAEVISEGVLWKKEDLIGPLSELIKLAFLLDFNEEAVQFLMKSKNLQIFLEDEDFLSAVFPSE